MCISSKNGAQTTLCQYNLGYKFSRQAIIFPFSCLLNVSCLGMHRAKTETSDMQPESDGADVKRFKSYIDFRAPVLYFVVLHAYTCIMHDCFASTVNARQEEEAQFHVMFTGVVLFMCVSANRIPARRSEVRCCRK